VQDQDQESEQDRYTQNIISQDPQIALAMMLGLEFDFKEDQSEVLKNIDSNGSDDLIIEQLVLSTSRESISRDSVKDEVHEELKQDPIDPPNEGGNEREN
jgi:hypothetical protein